MDEYQEYVCEVGLRVDDAGRLTFFGIDEVNERIRGGMVVKSIDKGRALMAKVTESAGSVRVRFEGFSIAIVLARATGIAPGEE